MREARVMEIVKQRLKPLKSKKGRTGSSVYGSTRGLGKGESEKQTSQRGQGEQGTSWKGYHVQSITGTWTLGKNTIST